MEYDNNLKSPEDRFEKIVKKNLEFNDRQINILEAAIKSNERPRWILYLLIIASVIIFSGWWNSLHTNWLRKRIIKEQEIIVDLNSFENQIKRNINFNLLKKKNLLFKSYNNTQSYIEKKTLSKTTNQKNLVNENLLENQKKEDSIFKACKVILFKDSLKLIDSLYEINCYLKSGIIENLKIFSKRWELLQDEDKKEMKLLWKLDDLQLIKNKFSKQLIEFEKIFTENNLVFNIILLGIKYDINDLGFISGFTLSIILILLYYGLFREYENLRIVFDLLKNKKEKVKSKLKKYWTKSDFIEKLNSNFKEEYRINEEKINKICDEEISKLKRRIYHYLSMSQLLSYPPLTSKPKLLFRSLAYAFFIVPLIVFILIFYNDINTSDIGKFNDPEKYIFLIISSGIFLVIMVIYTYRSLNIYYMMDKFWRDKKSYIELKNIGQALEKKINKIEKEDNEN